MNLLQLPGKKAPALRKKHREEGRDAIIHRQQILQETQEKRMQAETRKRQNIWDIHSKLRPHQGPCSEPADIDKLLTSYTSAVQRLRAVKAELQFQKLVLMHPSPQLKVTGTVPQLVRRLKQFLRADETAAATPLPQFEETQRPKKCPRVEPAVFQVIRRKTLKVQTFCLNKKKTGMLQFSLLLKITAFSGKTK